MKSQKAEIRVDDSKVIEDKHLPNPLSRKVSATLEGGAALLCLWFLRTIRFIRNDRRCAERPGPGSSTQPGNELLYDAQRFP